MNNYEIGTLIVPCPRCGSEVGRACVYPHLDKGTPCVAMVAHHERRDAANTVVTNDPQRQHFPF